eukprot:TRINITY_DN1694_c0_g1_i1.p1 TRINITY_DN1694_c0_g1~~TRINITY_DN1694_c0_g1_i1.p1  ORF type:complete len:192 (+),score=37.84 TRINITY_DN1694_c0_g1_i1:83-658(+)
MRPRRVLGRKRRRVVVDTFGGGRKPMSSDEVKKVLGESEVEVGWRAVVKFKVKGVAAMQVEEGRFKYVDKDRASYVISYHVYAFDCFLPPQDPDVTIYEVQLVLGTEETDSSQDVSTDEEQIRQIASWRAATVSPPQTVSTSVQTDEVPEEDPDEPATLESIQRTQNRILDILKRIEGSGNEPDEVSTPRK